jgi:hypothetical protein
MEAITAGANNLLTAFLSWTKSAAVYTCSVLASKGIQGEVTSPHQQHFLRCAGNG